MSDSVKPFRIAVLGLGWAGVPHIKLLKQIAGAEVIAIAETNEHLLKKIKAEHAVPWAFAEYRTMLIELPEIEAVDVCTPNGLHARNAIDFEYKMRHFVEVCRDNRPNEIPAEQALMVQKMIDAVYESAEKKKEVEVR